MGFRIEERFVVRAPADAVFAYLVDPQRVVTCLPGAALTEVADPRTFHGTCKVKVGAIVVGYRGTVRLTEVDEAGRAVRMSAEGRESQGAGAARMSMASAVVDRGDGETEVTVTADVDVAGRIVQLGRGMIEQVAHQLFLQFAGSVRAALEAEQVAPASAPAVAAGAGTAQRPAGPLAAAAQQPVRALPLLLRALWALLTGLFRRLLGPRPPRSGTRAGPSGGGRDEGPSTAKRGAPPPAG
jgi:uncharacterized protein